MVLEKTLIEVISNYGTQALGFIILIGVLYKQDIRNNKREDRLYNLLEKSQSFNESLQDSIGLLVNKINDLIKEIQTIYAFQKREHEELERELKDLKTIVRDKY